MDLNLTNKSTTVNTEAGIRGLWRQGVKVNKLAASWKMMEDLASKKIGVNEVERDAWNRTANRIVKKGYERPKMKGQYGSMMR